MAFSKDIMSSETNFHMIKNYKGHKKISKNNLDAKNATYLLPI